MSVDLGAMVAELVERRTQDRKVASLNPGRSCRRMLFSRVHFLCWFDVRSTQMLLQWHLEDPNHSTKSAGGKLHLYTHTHFTQRSLSGPTMLLSRHSVGTCLEMSSHTTCQGTFGHSHLSSLSRELISTAKKKKSAGGDWFVEHSPNILASEETAIIINAILSPPDW